MNTAIAERPTTSVSTVTPDQLDLVKRTVAAGATDAELKLYLYDCQRQGVHPLDRLLHFTKRGGKYTPVTSIDLMRIRAAETGDYVGSSDAEFVGTACAADFAATVTVSRKIEGKHDDIIGRFAATARWAEYFPGDQGGHMWRKMPHTMLAKCAEALALRKGFPRQLAGLYASEELDQAERTPSAGTSSVVTPQTPQITATSTDGLGHVVDVVTGEERPAVTRVAPEGYHFLTNYNLRSGWHEFDVIGLALNGSAMHLSTKRKFGELAAQAAVDGTPAKVTWDVKPNGRPGEGYCQSLTLYEAPKDDADQRRSIMDEEAF